MINNDLHKLLKQMLKMEDNLNAISPSLITQKEKKNLSHAIDAFVKKIIRKGEITLRSEALFDEIKNIYLKINTRLKEEERNLLKPFQLQFDVLKNKMECIHHLTKQAENLSQCKGTFFINTSVAAEKKVVIESPKP